MNTVGIICEYNPFHNGHMAQIERIRAEFGKDAVVVCLMSGNYVQRGAPAIFDKSVRTEAALRCGADLVLELPITAALSSAERFAAEGIRVLSSCCDTVCFGTESLKKGQSMEIAQILLSSQFSVKLKEALASGCSFPAARQIALEQMGVGASLVLPNDILGIEYCKAILDQNASLAVFPIHRPGSYHAETIDYVNPSASAIRKQIVNGGSWHEAVPDMANALFASARTHTLEAGERAILCKLRLMSESDFEALPFGSEGLWRKLMKASHSCASLEEIKAQTKSKRYTRTRIDRMVMCAFLGITEDILNQSPSYTRILGFSDSGRKLLRGKEAFRNAGEAVNDPYWTLEQACGDLYGLFSTALPEPPGMEQRRRIIYLKERL